MSVDPLNSRAVPSADSGKVAGSQSARRPEQPAEERHGEATHAAGDSVELSATSRALVEHADGAHGVPQGTMSSSRMQEVLRRLTDGYYDGAEVRAEVARRVGHDLGLSRPE